MQRNRTTPGTSLEIDSDGIAVITLKNPPVNALHPKGTLGFCGLGMSGSRPSSIFLRAR